MSFSIKIAGANFSNVVDKAVPYLSLSQGFWLFGGNQAASVKNLAPNASVANATIVGAGAPVYGVGYMDMSREGTTQSALDSGITLSVGHPFTYLVVASVLAGAGYDAQAMAGTWHDGITGADIVQGSSSGQINAAFSGGSVLTTPSSSVTAGQIAFAASTSSDSGRAVYLHDGTALLATTGAAISPPDRTTFRVGPFGARSANSTAKSRYCASMLFNVALTSAQLLELHDYFKFKLTKRGVVML